MFLLFFSYSIIQMSRLSTSKLPTDDLKVVIGKLSKLRSEMQTNKPLLPLESPSHLGDCEIWNKHLTKEVHRWFNSPWLLVECYMYRAIYAAFEDRYLLLN